MKDLIMELFIALYLVGYMFAVGYEYKVLCYYRRNDGLLNKVAGALLLGLLSWIIVGVGYYYTASGRKPPSREKKKRVPKPGEGTIRPGPL